MVAQMIDITTQDLTGEGYDLADKIELWLEAHPGLHTPSGIGRGVKATSTDAWQVLCWMEKRVYVAAAGNGKWRRYGSRR